MESGQIERSAEETSPNSLSLISVAGHTFVVLWFLAGAVVSFFASALLMLGILEWSNRMICAEGDFGSGCYEGELGISIGIFLVAYLPFIIPAVFHARGTNRRWFVNWWPLILLTAVPVGTATYFAIDVWG